MCAMETRATLSALLLMLILAVAEGLPSYHSVGGKLNLRPRFSEPITSILWKYNSDLLAEWSKADGFTYYDTFKGRTDLNSATAHLEISKLVKNDSGSYSVEINYVLQTETYTVQVIDEVPQPYVWISPASCGPESTTCGLSCEGDTEGAGPVTYNWKMGDGDWELSTKEKNITAEEVKLDKTFTCRIKNPVSEKESPPKENPLYKEMSAIRADVVIGVVVVLILAVLIGLAIWKKDPIKKLICPHESDTKGDCEAGAADAPASGNTPIQELTHLNSKPDPADRE